MKKEAQTRLDRINQLQKELSDKQQELESLLLPKTEIVIPQPAGFSFSEEVLLVVKGAGIQGISRGNILSELRNKFPDYGKMIDKKQVASTLAYLKNTKKMIEIIGRGIYRLKQDEKVVQAQNEIAKAYGLEAK